MSNGTLRQRIAALEEQNDVLRGSLEDSDRRLALCEARYEKLKRRKREMDAENEDLKGRISALEVHP
ncbi:MAG: hypothetical protein F4107_08080 [Gemmatimonadetes bacterium]|nr:hypothetical protein [Gemmatimonadota bacterium]MXX71184.1 hypothetical protein [Gemmatimonadota bacterium]MYD15043.1 hypothetical protein [Gemmatimonadota bacterium]MYI65876.1 hypothetical protein [Gemmatimonadota bacterium]